MRIIVLGMLLLGCSRAVRDLRPAVPVSPPSRLCRNEDLGARDFCVPSLRIEKLLRDQPFVVLAVRNTPHGVGGSEVLTLEFRSEGLIIKAKWKEAKPGGEGLDNDPRKEIAAWELQKILFAPDEYVVPPTVGRCIPVEQYDREVSKRHRRPTFDGAGGCVFGVLSYWLENVKELDGFSRERFETDRRYRERVVALNVFAYVIDHRDARKSNFLIAKDENNPRMFAIDNGLAFSGLRNPAMYFVHNWSELLVPALSRSLSEQLRRVTRADLDRLAVVSQFELRDGQLVPVAHTAPLVPDDGVRVHGDTVQLGLTTEEIDGVDRRLRQLLEKIDTRQIAVFEDVPGTRTVKR